MEEKIKLLEELLSEHKLMSKDLLSFNEAAHYLCLSKSYLYKLTSSRSIPYYKPQGKKCFFKKSELLDWALQNRQTPKSETECVAISIVSPSRQKGDRYVN